MKQEFFTKSKENLKIAQLSFDNECYNACANRAFQAAIAALAIHGISSEKSTDILMDYGYHMLVMPIR